MNKKYNEKKLLNDLIDDLKNVTNVKVSFYQESGMFTLKFDEHSMVIVKGIYEFNNTLLAIRNSIEYVKAIK
jgi:uridine kinase